MSVSSERINPELVSSLKRLRLGGLIETLIERLVLADKQDMSFEDFLLLVLNDQIARRDSSAASHGAAWHFRDRFLRA